MGLGQPSFPFSHGGGVLSIGQKRKFNVQWIHSLEYSIRISSITVTETVCVVELISNSRKFRHFRQYYNGRPKCGHIPYKRLQINIIQSFVVFFDFCKKGFPIFSAAMLDTWYENENAGLQFHTKLWVKKQQQMYRFVDKEEAHIIFLILPIKWGFLTKILSISAINTS